MDGVGVAVSIAPSGVAVDEGVGLTVGVRVGPTPVNSL